MQIYLDDLHDGVVDGVVWYILHNRVVSHHGNDRLAHAANDFLVNAARTTPCIAPYKRRCPDADDTVPQCRDINDKDQFMLSRIVDVQAFVKQNGTKLKRGKG